MHGVARNISIIGSGPSGLYTAYHLIKKSKIPLNIKVWEKNPVPFGLSRYGVAPDHPEVKNCEIGFTDMFRHYKEMGNGACQSLQFIGNVTIDSPELPLKRLIDEEDVVVFSYGCTGDRKLNIPNESDTVGVFSSREFVNWYNGQFDMALHEKFMKFDWSKVKRVGIIGNGNVALDIVRVLISNKVYDMWEATDISSVALEKLKQAPIENVKVIARRDFLRSKFTNKEMRELLEMEKYGLFGNINATDLLEGKIDSSKLDRPRKRLVEMCMEYMKPFNERTKKNYKKIEPPMKREESPKIWEFEYLQSPLAINRNPITKQIQSLTVSQNEVTSDNKVVQLEGRTKTYDLDLLITSLGYKGIPLKSFEELGVKFDRDHIGNFLGRVVSTYNATIPGLYASGWIRKGSQGVIATTMQDSFAVAEEILRDLPTLAAKGKGIDVGAIPHTTWEDWEIVDSTERSNGLMRNKPREKFLTVDEVLACVRE